MASIFQNRNKVLSNRYFSVSFMGGQDFLRSGGKTLEEMGHMTLQNVCAHKPKAKIEKEFLQDQYMHNV